MSLTCDTPPVGTLLAWVSTRGSDIYVGAFVGEDAVVRAARAPATRLFGTQDDARRWVEDEAAALGLPVKWVREAP